MPSFSFPTRYEGTGPWFLDKAGLGEFDRLVDSCCEMTRQNREEEIETAVLKRKSELFAEGKGPEQIKASLERLRNDVEAGRLFGTVSRRLQVGLKNGAVISGETFSELAKMPRFHAEIPERFSLNVMCGETRVRVVNECLGDTSYLRVDVSSGNSAFAEDVFGLFRSWAFDREPSRFLRAWYGLGTIGIVGAISGLCVGAFLAVFLILSVPQSGPSPVKQDALNLAKQGVSQANRDKAIGLILSIESGYEPTPPARVQHFSGMRFYLYLALVASLIFTMGKPPRGAIALWGGRRSLERQLIWRRFVMFSTPSTLFITIVLPWVLHALGSQH
jgi:hypothetical protein